MAATTAAAAARSGLAGVVRLALRQTTAVPLRPGAAAAGAAAVAVARARAAPLALGTATACPQARGRTTWAYTACTRGLRSHTVSGAMRTLSSHSHSHSHGDGHMHAHSHGAPARAGPAETDAAVHERLDKVGPHGTEWAVAVYGPDRCAGAALGGLHCPRSL